MEKLDILFEDNQVIVVNKPANVPTQEDESGDKDLLTMVKEYVKEKYNKAGEVFIGLVHRLDRPTAGMIVFARNSKSASRLSQQIKDKTFEKTYLVVVEGVPRDKKSTLINYLKKDEKENKVKLAPMLEEGVKKAELSYEVLDTQKNLSLVKVRLETGRSHQIRVQMANIGYPVFGDNKYGKNNAKTSNLALFAFQLVFRHPTLNQTMNFKIYPDEQKLPWSLFDIEKFI